MTEYGRGSGSEPWHPNDPPSLPAFGQEGPEGYQGWGGQQAADGSAPYGGQQHYPQQAQQTPQPQYGGQYENQYENQYQDQYEDPYGGQQGGYPQHDFNGGWDTAQQQPYGADPYGSVAPDPYGAVAPDPYGAVAPDPYGAGAPDPYGAGAPDPYGGAPANYGAEHPDPYDTPDAYPPPQPPGRRGAVPDETPDWDPGPNDREHAFFAGGNDDDDDYDDDPRESRRGRGERRGRGGKKKRRSGCACLVVALVFAAGIGGAGYFGFQFFQDRFGAPEDYAGNGTGKKVVVEVPRGAGGGEIGALLKRKGVVKSADAFVAAQGEHTDGLTIQAGVYTLNTRMSGKAAVELMLDPKSRNNLIIPEGKQNAWVYEQIDKRLELPKDTTKKYAKKHWKELGLPNWATTNVASDVKDPLEGFLYPSSYPVAKGQEPGDVLKKMVATSSDRYDSYNLQAKAEELNLKNPLEVITVASLVQAEGKYKHDFEKVSTVVYNRLKPDNTETYGLLDFDSTVNYLRGKSELATGSVDELRKIEDPYNTYWPGAKGLPPGPIANPGAEALKAAMEPAKGNWYYFVSINADKTVFAETNEEHERNRKKYLEEQEKNGS